MKTTPWTAAQLVALSHSLETAYGSETPGVTQTQRPGWTRQRLLQLSAAKAFPFSV